ncbi:uncharacterized protein N7515_003208 [Penicillium bovifimosum]|uniref:Uncharacterized protein n=1 Tax=Penicillium bovifimosum TaxID=126998 RepID=A0A9W9L603_9EURO|nr:uncharacterized protein N7515_003208 [Penicillium bovifimosum]KAJ5138360.1 hypothetical protein N7515_003208 [Penicillium bovifimosum]
MRVRGSGAKAVNLSAPNPMMSVSNPSRLPRMCRIEFSTERSEPAYKPIITSSWDVQMPGLGAGYRICHESRYEIKYWGLYSLARSQRLWRRAFGSINERRSGTTVSELVEIWATIAVDAP